MVSENCIFGVIAGFVHLLMLSGIFYSESQWLSASSQRIDLLLLFACQIVIIGLFITMKFRPYYFAGQYMVFIAWMTAAIGTIGLAGIHMIVGLILWKVDSAQSEHLTEDR